MSLCGFRKPIEGPDQIVPGMTWEASPVPQASGSVAAEPNWGGPIDGGEIDSAEPSTPASPSDSDDGQDDETMS